jgi:hypothetical protein
VRAINNVCPDGHDRLHFSLLFCIVCCKSINFSYSFQKNRFQELINKSDISFDWINIVLIDDGL